MVFALMGFVESQLYRPTKKDTLVNTRSCHDIHVCVTWNLFALLLWT